MADEDWFSANAPKQEEPDWFTANAPQVATQERSIPSKIGHAVVDTLKSFVPQSVGEAALAPVKALPGVGKVGTILSNIAFGKPIGEGLSPLAGIPVVQRIPEIIAAEKTPAGSQERFTTAAGTLLDLSMIAGLKAAPEVVDKPKLAEVAGIAKPEVTQPIEPVATTEAQAAPIAPEVAPSVPAAMEATTAAPIQETSEVLGKQEPVAQTGEVGTGGEFPTKTAADLGEMYHGSLKGVKGAPKTGKDSGTIKTKFGDIPVVGTVFDGFFLTKDAKYAELYSAGKQGKVESFSLHPDSKVLSLPNISSEEVLSSRGWGRAKGLTSLKQPTDPFPFQKDFENYAFDRLNQERVKNGKQPFTTEQFQKQVGDEWNPTKDDYDLNGLAAKYLPDYIKSKGFDAVEFGREVIALNPEKVVRYQKPLTESVPQPVSANQPIASELAPESVASPTQSRPSEIVAQEPPSVPSAEEPTTAKTSQEIPTGSGIQKEVSTPTEVARPEPQIPSTFSVQMPTDTFGTEHTPVSSFLAEQGLMSKSTARRNGMLKKNPDLWDDAQNLHHPTHNKIYSSETVPIIDKKTGEVTGSKKVGKGGLPPDIAAQMLHDAGLISDPSVGTMWKAIADESKSSRNILKSQKGEIETQKFKLQETSKQAQDFGKAQQKGWKEGEPVVPVRDLQVGDQVTVGSEKLKVIDIDPDNFDVTLEDGKKYGVQTVKDNTVIYGEHETPSVAAKLLPGETQGDLISSTQKEPFALVGEKGTDFGVQQAAVEKATAERAQSEKGQMELGENVAPLPTKESAAPTVPPTEPPPTPAETAAANSGETTGIAARYRESEQPGSVIEGVGKTPDEARAFGHDFINKGGNPYDAISNKGPKRELWQDVGIARAEYERLGNEKRAAEAQLEANPNDQVAQMAFDNADLAQRQWSKDAQPILTRAGDALRAATRSYPREINTFSDFTDIVNDHFKGEVELTPEKRAELQKAVKAIKKGNLEATEARAQVTNEAIKKAGGKTMSFDDLKTSLTNKMTKLLEDCAI